MSCGRPIALRAPTLWLLAATLWAGCSGPESERPATDVTPDPETLQIVSVRTADVLLVGSVVVVDTRGVDPTRSSRLEVADAALPTTSNSAVSLESTDASDEGSSLEFHVTTGLLSALGPGTHSVALILVQGNARSSSHETSWTLADRLDVQLTEAPGGRVFRNDEAILRGSGIIAPEEGTFEAHLSGSFTPTEGAARPVDVRLPVRPAERFARDRGLLRLSTAIGGLEPGVFDGSVALEAGYIAGGTSTSGPLSTRLEFQLPTVFSIDPVDPVLGQIVTVRGGGFVGSADEPDEATVLRFEGSFTNDEGITLDFPPAEAVAVYRSGQEVALPIEVEVRGLGLVADFFGHRRGVLDGTVTVITIKGVDEVQGQPTPVTLTLDGVRQVVVVHFLPGFLDSLRHFGLASADAEVRQAVIERMRGVYAEYAVEIRIEEPTDFLESAYANLEIGGPDPNGLGLLGYDNSPGKDVGNVRLFDTIGGANAETQADGFPGYGGVFIDSFLYWSTHPDLPVERPFGAPEPDPLFDEIFDVVRMGQPVTLEEARGEGEPTRTEAVQRAIAALGSIIGETAAHELGHSLGLAQPFGPADAYHSPIPGEGCLMDSGAERPFGERAAQPGFTQSRFCFDEPDYLGEILPR